MSDRKLRKSSLYPFPFLFCLSSPAMPSVGPQSGCTVLTQLLILKHLMNTPLGISYVVLNLVKLIINY